MDDGRTRRTLRSDRPVTIRIGGVAGQGTGEAAVLVGRVLARAGWHVLLTVDAPAQVRGGHAFHTVTAAPPGTRAPHAPHRTLDVLVVLSAEAASEHEHWLAVDGVVVADDALKLPNLPLPLDRVWRLPFVSWAAAAGGSERIPAVVAGALIALLGLTREVLEATFDADSKGDVVAALRRSYEATLERLDAAPSWAVAASSSLWPNGNEALAFGAFAAGCRFMGAYPMTPATTIAEWLIAVDPVHGVTVVDAEDEIGAVTMAAGASYAGVRAMTATSGGGLALMVEAIGFAAMAEIPLVVVDAMRPGPSTGMPTRTEQGDLLFAVHLAQGDIPHIVLAPGDVGQCFEQAWRAFNLADLYQCPVILLTDARLATTRVTVPSLALDPARVQIDRGRVRYGDDGGVGQGPFRRYSFTQDGISERAWPGDPGGVHTVSSYEHDAAGHIAESPANRVAAMDRRLDRLALARESLDGPLRYGPEQADVTLVCWGSTAMACREAVDLGERDGLSINALQFVDLWPFPSDAACDAFRHTKRVLLVEQNATGQLGTLVRAETGLHLPGRLLKYDGRALGPEEILERGLPLARQLSGVEAWG